MMAPTQLLMTQLLTMAHGSIDNGPAQQTMANNENGLIMYSLKRPMHLLD